MGYAGGGGVHIPFFAPQHTAQNVRDYLEDEIDAVPWALSLARKCYDMPTGRLVHLPFSGGIWDQDEMLLNLIGIAWRTWWIVKFKPMNEMKWDEGDSAFLAWIDDDGNI